MKRVFNRIFSLIFILSVLETFPQSCADLEFLSYDKEGIKKITIYESFVDVDTFLYKEIYFDSIGRIVKEIFDYNVLGMYRERDYYYVEGGSCVVLKDPYPMRVNAPSDKILKDLFITYENDKILKVTKGFISGENEITKYNYPRTGDFKIISEYFEGDTLKYTRYFKCE